MGTLKMKLSISVLIGVIATIAGVSSLELDLGYAGESLSDIPKEKRVDALFNHLDAWEMRRGLLSKNEMALKKRGGSGESSVQDSIGDVVVNVKIGSEKSEVPMLVDTGSPSTLVKDDFYNSNKSSTWADPLALFMVGYLSGQGAKGPVVADDFYFGDLTAKSFPIGILTKKYYGVVMNEKIGGLLAIMYPGLAENQWYNGQPQEVDLISNLKYQGAIDNRKWQMSIGKGGKLIIGDHDDSLAEGGFQEMTNSGMSQNHVGIKGMFNDVGAELKEVDSGNVIGLVDCKNPPTLKFSATEGDLEIEIPKDDITSKEAGDGKCILPISGSEKVGTNGSLRHMPNAFVVGETYLRHVTFATDFDSPMKVWIGKQKSN